MMKLLVTAVVLCGLVNRAAGMVVLDKCPSVTGMEDFDYEQFVGTWYERWRFPNFMDFAGTCSEMKVGKLRALKRIRVTFQGKRGVPGLEMPYSIGGNATPKQGSTSAHNVRFEVALRERRDFIVLDTDYVNYALVFICSTVLDQPFSMQTAIILSRDRSKSPDNMKDLRQLLKDNGISPLLLVPVVQLFCDSSPQ